MSRRSMRRIDSGALGGAVTASGLQAFVSPAAPVVRGIHINTARPGPGHRFDITDYGPTGLNYSDPNHTIWGHDTYFDASGPLRAAIAAAAAAAAAARAASPSGVAPDQVVFFPPGIYNVQGGFHVPDGVYVAGAGADVTAIYVAYDDQTTAPLAYFSPAVPGGSWGLSDLSIYCLSFFYNIIHIPASPFGRFRASRLTIRADAFHNKNGVGGLGGNPRAAAWSLNANAKYGGQGGYQPAVFRLGPATNTTAPGAPLLGPFGAASNVAVEDCDVSGSWHLFQGKVEYGVLSRNTLYNGGATWYLIARQTIIEVLLTSA